MSHIPTTLGLHYVVNEICILLGFYTAKIGSLLPMSHLQGSSCLDHENGTNMCPETMVSNYLSMLCKIPEECGSHASCNLTFRQPHRKNPTAERQVCKDASCQKPYYNPLIE